MSRAPQGTQIRGFSGRFGATAINWVGLESFAVLPTTYGEAVLEAAKEAAEQLAKDMEEYAKDNAPWTDQTGAAREALNTQVINEKPNVWTVVLAQGVDYGVFLENHNGGEFAIIIPTIEHFQAELGGRILAGSGAGGSHVEGRD